MRPICCFLLLLGMPLLCLAQDSRPIPVSAFTLSPQNDSSSNIFERSAKGPNPFSSASLQFDLHDTPRDTNDAASSFVTTTPSKKNNGLHWGRALFESFMLLSIEQAYVVHDDYRWVVSENGIPFNHYWRDYKQSLSSWVHAGWSDGDPNMYGYVGHPIQGVATSYIFLQNDPRYEKIEFANTRQYWKSRLMATLFNAAYSTQWNLGPLSEVTVEKYGTKDRSPWNTNGTWPCNTKHCYTGVGQIDIVMTPVGGLGWLVGEDWLDKNVTRRIEGATSNRLLIDSVRCGLDPIRVGTNLLHGKRPWYRASRDSRGDDLSDLSVNTSTSRKP